MAQNPNDRLKYLDLSQCFLNILLKINEVQVQITKSVDKSIANSYDFDILKDTIDDIHSNIANNKQYLFSKKLFSKDIEAALYKIYSATNSYLKCISKLLSPSISENEKTELISKIEYNNFTTTLSYIF